MRRMPDAPVSLLVLVQAMRALSGQTYANTGHQS